MKTFDQASSERSEAGAGGGPAIIEPMPLALLDEPLEFIFADHFRERQLCAALRRIAAVGQCKPAEADALASYMTRDLKLHHQDEDEDLFPALLRRARTEDDLEAILARLAADHEKSETLATRIAGMLSAHTRSGKPEISAQAAKLMEAYANSENKHLAVENGLVLAIARVRLTRKDLHAVSRGMKRRRGVVAQ